ncbi:dihydropteroate synthase-like protein [Methanobacterium alcaliphilum]|uniref:dihydropteroate synthase-like protein n=1 Tax=Methanobacterium alcaliphilum TaxID=392018 RepID=UPI00200A9196|nr:dihydropteroate synthase-like protein [Methanobacterium alcaliphilum]MCK9152147.1 dihydropteroate synthase-like protein [Methanobacterium alcaliphilum]
MKVLIVTGKLANPLVQSISKKSKQNVEIHVVNNPIAAFLTPQKISKELQSNSEIDLGSIDLIIIPGLIRKDASFIKEKLGVSAVKGPTDAADLQIVLDMLDDIELSPKTSADRLIEEEQRKKALEFIENFEKNEENKSKLLKKQDNIMVGNLPVGKDFPMRVLAEIANAPFLTKGDLIKRTEYFIKSGADMVDIGMVAGEDLSHKIPEMVETLKNKFKNTPISIDTLNPVEIESAVESGVDMVLSLDHGNCDSVLPLIEEKQIPAVILPTNFQEAWVPETVDGRVKSLEELRKKCRKIDVIADPILDPINSSSIVDSLRACQDFHQKNPEPLFFGIGNVTELLDTDSVGVNSLLSGIAMELEASILFTPEESGKTLRSVYELAVSSKMMFLARNRGSVPKDLGINLVVFKDKRKLEKMEIELDVPIVKATGDQKFVQDRAGSFKIMVDDNQIKVVHYKKMEPTMVIVGQTAKKIYGELLKLNLISRLEHATYMGAELQKAEIALITNKNYTQDFELFKKPFEIEKEF